MKGHRVYKYVFHGDVPVADTMLVAVVDSSKQLLDDEGDLRLGELILDQVGAFDKLCDVTEVIPISK